MQKNQKLTNSLLLAFIIIENLCLYYLFKMGILTQGKNAILLFLSAVLFGLTLLYKFYNVEIVESERITKKNWGPAVSLSLLAVGMVAIGFQYNEFFLQRPLSYKTSDVIPLIQVACRRLLSGEYPYAMVHDFGYAQDMTYLPLHWMPFTIAELLHIDYRWIPYSIWGIGAAVLCLRSSKLENVTSQALIALFLLASNYVLFCRNNGFVEASVELMMAGYYMMLISGFNTKNGVLQGIIIGVCLLSRYSLVLWLPLYAFTLFITGQRKQLLIAAGIATAMVLLIYVLPFMTRDPYLFYNGYKYYDKAASFEWTHLNDAGKPANLFAGTGFAYYFYTRFTHLDIPERIKLLQRTHLIACLSVTFLMGVWFWFKRNKINPKIFILGSFKIYLAVFLFLIQAPYEYLSCVSIFVSMAIFVEQLRYKVVDKPGAAIT
jgi:hypothetical protein